MKNIPLTSSVFPSQMWYREQNKSHITWERYMFWVGVFSFFLDPVFVFISSLCLPASICMDLKLGVNVALVRTIADLIFLFGAILRFKFKRTQDVTKEPSGSGLEYSNRTFAIHLASILPIPQVYLWYMRLTSDTYLIVDQGSSLIRVVFIQIPLRMLSMSPLTKNMIEMTGRFPKSNAWMGALINLMYFILASNVAGAIYYHTYLSKLLDCKRIVFQKEVNHGRLEWDQLVSACTKKYEFENGMFSDAFMTKLATRSFTQRYVYSLCWGLKSFSSFGQIFNASSSAGETIFSFSVVVFGLILFGDLLARMQSGLQYTEVREDRQRARQRAVEEWTNYHQLPTHLRKRVKQAIQSEWSETRGINNEAIMDSLPPCLRSEIRRHLYLELVRSLPVFANMDDELINAICGHLRAVSANEGTYLLFEGDPVRELLFIFNGQLRVSNGSNSEGNTSRILGQDDLCGGELLQWSSIPVLSTDDLPLSTHTIKCITDVEAFSLPVEDVKLLAIQYYRNKKFHQALRQHASWLGL